MICASHTRVVSGGGGDPADPSDPIARIRLLWRMRQRAHRAEKALTLQAFSQCTAMAADGLGAEATKEEVYKAGAVLLAAAKGKGEHPLKLEAAVAIEPYMLAQKPLEARRVDLEKELVKLARTLPIAGWIESVRGVGLLSLAGIVGEAGDLSNYSNPAKLWKRMGLAVNPDGTRQRRISGDAAIEQAYSPARRSLVWTIGDCMIRAGGALKDLYDERKVYEAPRVKTKMHAHNRAKRYMEKRFLRDLWRAWRGQIASAIQTWVASSRPSQPDHDQETRPTIQ